MTEYWYLSKPLTAFEVIGEKDLIKTKSMQLIEIAVEQDCGLYFANCKDPHFQVNAKTKNELVKNIEQTYHLIEAEFRRVYDR